MAFSGVLPRVVNDVGPGGPLVTSGQGVNALINGGLENQIKGVQAQYAPYTAYADAASKLAYANMTPYQIQAQMLSNPMLWMAMKDHPEAMQNMMSSFANTIPRGNQIFGGVNMPNPAEQNKNPLGNGLMGLLLNKMHGQDSSQPEAVNNALNSIPGASAPQNALGNQMGSPLLPGAGGGMSAVQAKMMAPYSESPHKQGVLFTDQNTGQPISTPTASTVSSGQQQLLATQRVEPQLKRLAKEWEPFLDVKGKAKLLGSQATNLIGLTDSDLPSKYAKAKATTATIPEALIKSYGLKVTNESLNRLERTIEPIAGETPETYKNRIAQSLEELRKDQMAQTQQALANGFNLSNSSVAAPSAQQSTVQPENLQKISAGAKSLANGLQLPKFESAKEYQDWFRRQPLTTQQAIHLHFGKK